MRAKGYEIKGEAFGEDAPKFISFRPLGKDRFVRGSVKSLGREYTKERIKERIELKRERKAVIPKRDYANKRLIPPMRNSRTVRGCRGGRQLRI